MELGDILNIKTLIDTNTQINQSLIITYIYKDIILTCGHCLPPNAIIPDGKILYTSGFDNPYEGYELGIIQILNNN